MDSILKYPSFSFKLSISSTQSFHYYPFSFLKLNSFKKFKKTSTIAVSLNPNSNPQKPSSLWQKFTSPMKKIASFRSILHSIRSLEEKTSMKQWVSAFPGESKCLQNGGFGMGLLSVTATAKVRISPFVVTLAANPTFVSGFFAWMLAQTMKVFLHFCFEKKWDLRIMCASGGMPSSHSALCTALTTSVAICHGVADSLFPVCLGFSLIVMYDAIGVRRHAGMQAEVLNLIIQDLFQGHPIIKRKLKELLGHTPSQVVAGAVLGILVACICCQSCIVAV